MRTVPEAITEALGFRDFTGARRAVTRVTIAKSVLGTYPYGTEVYSSMPFPGPGAQGAVELPNLKAVSWNRSTEDPVATCHLDLYNTQPLPPGSEMPIDDSYDQVGYYTFNRGQTALANSSWGQTPNKWQDFLVPDRVLRVYQGYGANYDVVPEDDPHLVLMGIFVIDEVTYSHDGTIAVDARDFGRLLMDQIAFPPVVPLPRYPLHFTHYHDVPNPDIITNSGSLSWRRGTYDSDSNVGYVGRNGAQYGHHGTDAFDNNSGTYWLSMGNGRPDQPYSFEWIQTKASGKINGARANVWGGPYTYYLSVRVGGTWQGTQTVPYDPRHAPALPNGSNITYILTGSVGRDGTVELTFPELDNVTAVRFTFTNLFDSGLGEYQYRAGVRTFDILSDTRATKVTPGGTHREGNYEDYTDIVKLLLAYGGFWWPPGGMAYQKLTDQVAIIPYLNGDDPVLAGGRIWGDIMVSGVPEHNLINDLNVDVFNMKSLMDGITHVRDMIGFIFFIDENGGAIFRLPNIFKRNNRIIDADGLNGKATTTDAMTIRDEEFILSLRSRLSSRNSRERVVVSNLAGQLGAVAKGRMAQDVNFRRVAVYSDQYFTRQSDVTVMADLIALRQLFTYRQNTLQIAADPRIQIDDQIQIEERVTGENFLHYVGGISSQWSASDGKWTYDLTTSWLGVDPDAQWAFTTNDLQDDTYYYLQALGQV